jgi:hypothetical protein
VVVGETDCVPVVVCAAVQPLEAVHDVAFVADHVRVELAPEVMLAGFAVSVTVGVAGAEVSVMVALADFVLSACETAVIVTVAVVGMAAGAV